MKNKKGITLVSLIIIIVVLLILSSIATYSGINVIKSSRLTAFTTELKIMQTHVNAMYETKKEESKQYGEDISQNSQAIKIFNELKKKDPQFSNIEENIAEYKYWDKGLIEKLGIEGIEQTFLINIEKRSVVSYEGFEYGEEIFYTLSQLPDNLYNVEYEKKEFERPKFDVRKENINSDKSRFSIFNIQYKGYINKWEVKYRLKEEQNWKTSQDLSFVVNEQGIYEIQIVNDETKSEIKEVLIAKNYIKDGLLLHYDGINNTGEGDDKHSTTTTTWKDLSGKGNDGKLVNNPTWEVDNLSFDGIDDYVETQMSSNGDVTIEFVAKQTSVINNSKYAPLYLINEWSANILPFPSIQLFYDGIQENNTIYGRCLVPATETNPYREKALNSVNNTDQVCYTITKNQNSVRVYDNGEYLGEYSDTDFLNRLNVTKINLFIGSWERIGVKAKQKVNSMRIYNRKLTEGEIKVNHEIDKIRFGIE